MRRRKRRSRLVIAVIVPIIVIAGGWWLWPRGNAEFAAQANSAADQSQPASLGEPHNAAVPEAVIAADTSASERAGEVLTPAGSGEEIALREQRARDSGQDRVGQGDGAGPMQASDVQAHLPHAQATEGAAQPSGQPRIAAALRRYEAGQVIAARGELNRLLAISRDPAEQAELRRHLKKIADGTIFSRRWRPDDPLTAMYTIRSGDMLINIGKQFGVPHDVIMMINGIEDPRRIRAGQRIKVPRGPFHARIYQSHFRLDVYLQDLYLRSFPVGLGAEQSTPEGKWIVKDRLQNPTYYPPASARDKRIIPPDDPTNPLGEHWIDLQGIEGDAAGREGYGIHGTIEPGSIGQAVSLGCIRMHNEDVTFLYGLMMRGRSTVTTLP